MSGTRQKKSCIFQYLRCLRSRLIHFYEASLLVGTIANICYPCCYRRRVQTVKAVVCFGSSQYQERCSTGKKQHPRSKETVVCRNKNTFLTTVFCLVCSQRSSARAPVAFILSVVHGIYRSVFFWTELVGAVANLQLFYCLLAHWCGTRSSIRQLRRKNARLSIPRRHYRLFLRFFAIMGMLSCLCVIDDISKTNFS